MVHEIHATKEPAVLASAYYAEIGVIAVVCDDETAAGREVTWNCNDVSLRFGSALKHQYGGEEPAQEEHECELSDCFLIVFHCLIPLWALGNSRRGGSDHHIRN